MSSLLVQKNGYITNDGDYPAIDTMEYMYKMFVSTEIIKPDDISSGYNVLNPNYIARCIDKSLSNMHLNTLDLVYIHNAFESWYKTLVELSLCKCFIKFLKFMKNIGHFIEFLIMEWQHGHVLE